MQVSALWIYPILCEKFDFELAIISSITIKYDFLPWHNIGVPNSMPIYPSLYPSLFPHRKVICVQKFLAAHFDSVHKNHGFSVAQSHKRKQLKQSRTLGMLSWISNPLEHLQITEQWKWCAGFSYFTFQPDSLKFT